MVLAPRAGVDPVRALLPMYRKTDIDVHHCLAQPPFGDTTVAQVAAAYGDDVTALIAVDPVMLEEATPREVARHVRSMVEQAAGWRSFAVITSSKLQVKEANLEAVAGVASAECSPLAVQPAYRDWICAGQW